MYNRGENNLSENYRNRNYLNEYHACNHSKYNEKFNRTQFNALMQIFGEQNVKYIGAAGCEDLLLCDGWPQAKKLAAINFGYLGYCFDHVILYEDGTMAVFVRSLKKLWLLFGIYITAAIGSLICLKL